MGAGGGGPRNIGPWASRQHAQAPAVAVLGGLWDSWAAHTALVVEVVAAGEQLSPWAVHIGTSSGANKLGGSVHRLLVSMCRCCGWQMQVGWACLQATDGAYRPWWQQWTSGTQMECVRETVLKPLPDMFRYVAA